MAAADAHSSAAAPHVLLLPYPAQGHVIPFMELAYRLLDTGFTVTFVNTEFNHHRVQDAATSASLSGRRLRLVGVADGMDDGEDRDNLVQLNATMQEAMPPQLEALLDGDQCAGTGDGLGKVTCVVVDVLMSWALDGVKRRSLPAAALWVASAAVLAVLVGAKKLIRDGVIDDDGAPIKLENNCFHLAESIRPMDATFLAWNKMGNNRDAERLVFHYLTNTAWAAVAKADFLLCNTFAELEPNIFTEHYPVKILPIGPLRTWKRPATEVPIGHFWHVEDVASLSFLDAQPPGSVVYVAFGSLTVMSSEQLEQIALGLVASGRPFLWVLRPGVAAKLPTSVTDKAATNGTCKVVKWAPQEQVLAHPAIGCFITHCGWNSTLESIRNGVPMLCWPYFTDQFTNQTYVCDIWRVGLRVAASGSEEMVNKRRITEMLDSLLGDSGIKERLKKLKALAERSMSVEGHSLKNIKMMMEYLRK